MPKRKNDKGKKIEEEDDGDAGGERERPKKSKSEKNDSDEKIELGKMKFVDVREFKGMILVDIREYYEDNNGELKPGKKGISLQAAQWETLKENMEKIDAKIEGLGN